MSSDPQEAQSRVCACLLVKDSIDLMPRMCFSKRRMEMMKQIQISKGRRKTLKGSMGGGWLASLQQSGTDVQEGSFLKRGVLSLITPK